MKKKGGGQGMAAMMLIPIILMGAKVIGINIITAISWSPPLISQLLHPDLFGGLQPFFTAWLLNPILRKFPQQKCLIAFQALLSYGYLKTALAFSWFHKTNCKIHTCLSCACTGCTWPHSTLLYACLKIACCSAVIEHTFY